MNFMIVDHTHGDIDALFGRWSMVLKKRLSNSSISNEVVHGC